MLGQIVLLSLLSGIASWSLSVTDPSGNPVRGASIIDPGEGRSEQVLLGTTDSLGRFKSPGEPPETCLIRQPGFRPLLFLPRESHSTVRMSVLPVSSGVLIEVRAERYGLRDLAGFSTTTVDRKTAPLLENLGLSSVEAYCPGINVREYGGAIPVLSVAVRGADPGQISYSVDGHDISSVLDGAPGEGIDPALFGSVEVARGGSSAFRSGGMAGSLCFTPEAPSGPASVSIGADHRGGARIISSLGIDDVRLSFSGRRSTGAADASEAYSGAALITLLRPDLRLGILGNAASGETEAPDWSPDADGERVRSTIDLWGAASPSSWNLAGGLRLGRMRYHSTSPEPVDDVHREGRTDVSVSRMVLAPALSPVTVDVGASLKQEWVRSTALGNRSRSVLDAGFTAQALSNIPLTIAGKYLIWPGAGPEWAVRAELSRDIADSSLILSAAVCRNFRLPSFNDLYWPADAFAEGNEDLAPESGWEAEMGLSSSPTKSMRLSASAFSAHTKDLIMWLPAEGGIWRPENVSESHKMGLETSAWIGLDSAVELLANLTLLRATDETEGSTNEGKILPYRPQVTWGLTGIWRTDALSVSVQLQAIGERFTNRSQTASLPGYRLANCRIECSLPWTPLRGELWCENVLDEYYEESVGYRGRPRTVGLALTWKGN
ncbi:TonB-dependent receptor [Candidatus Fermentibacteria bacterium]|nr:TonB-dependent receptor [Candidatus Fermentibacteria bacterium]